jgi:hypothetical protein
MHELALFLQNIDPDVARKVATLILTMIPIIILVAILILMIPFWFICKKAGFSPWLSLLCIIPSLGTLVLLYVLAFAQWKVVPAPQMGYMPPQPYPPQPPLPPQTPQA